MAFVEKVNKDGTLILSEMNMGKQINKKTGRTSGWNKVTRAKLHFDKLNRGIFRFEGIVLPVRAVPTPTTTQPRG